MQNMWQRFLDLAVVPVEAPLPMSMLRRLWGLGSDTDAEATANLLNQLGVMKVACLTDSTAWALVQPGHLKALHVSAQSHICRHLPRALGFTGQGLEIVDGPPMQLWSILHS